MLSGLEIKKQIGLGNIVISDFDEKRLNPNSYNIRLGNKLKVYEIANYSSEDIQREIEQPFQAEYIEILSKLKNPDENMSAEEYKALEEEVKEKMDDLEVRITNAREEAIWKYALDPKKDNPTIDIEIPEKGYILVPGVLYLGETMEYTETYNFIPNIDGRSTTGRLGIEIHRTAGFGDNGFKGKWTLEITVTHPVIVYPGMEIGQLYYEKIDGDTSMKYDGKYQNQQGVEAAKVDKEK